jgi:tetratricopeptide (TPR) repeat protein
MSDSWRTDAALNDEVARLCEEGKHTAALEVARQALLLAREDLAANIPSLNDATGALLELGQSVGLLALRFGGVSFPGAGLLLQILASHIQDAQAQAQLAQALEIRRRAMGTDDTGLIEKLSNLAMVFQEMGHFEKASSFMGTALTLCRHERGTTTSAQPHT